MCSSGTGAFVVIDQVNAGAPVLAGLGETLIDLLGAVGPNVAWYTLRGERREREGEGERQRGREREGGREGGGGEGRGEGGERGGGRRGRERERGEERKRYS